jgi:hypothetical protein
MYYLFKCRSLKLINPENIYYGRETKNIIFAFSSKNKNELMDKIKNTVSFTKNLGDFFNFVRLFGVGYKSFINLEFWQLIDETIIKLRENGQVITLKEEDLFEELYKRYGNKLIEKIKILKEIEIESKREIISHISFMNEVGDTKYSIEWIESPLYNMLQFSNDKEINPVVYDFVNHSLFDRNVLGLINEY